MYCDYIASLRNEVYPASDLAARPTSRAPMSDLLVDFQCTLGLLCFDRLVVFFYGRH